ncbi:MAG: AI-2E family transporter [Propionibacteriaceae bacterium]|jgi:predicted PurR-regulated permease PerM|nr:AI-2E family transporter [Propionibacteriaceae bacterium]
METDTPSVAEHSRARSFGLPQFVVGMIGLVGALGALVLMRELGTFLAPMFLALNLVIAAYPLHAFLVSKGAPAWVGATVMALAVIVILLFAVGAIVWAVNDMVNVLPEYSAQYSKMINSIIDLIRQFDPDIETTGIMDILKKIDPNSIVNVATSLLSQTSAILGGIVVIVASLIFFAMDTPGFADRVRLSAKSNSHVSQVLSSFGSGVRRYWLVTSFFGAIIAALDGVALVILGVPMPMVWVILSFLTNYIPNVGFVVGLAPPALLALLGGGWQKMLALIIVYSVLNFAIQSVIQPRFTGDAVGINASASFISLLVWGWVFGGLGALLALPMTLLVKAVLLDIDPNTKWLDALVSSNPFPADKKRTYGKRKKKSVVVAGYEADSE